MSGKTRFFALASPVVIIIVLVGIGAFQFMQYRNNGLDGLQRVPAPNVAITSPQPYSQASVRFPVHVNVTANGYKPFKSVELWVNGMRMGQQDAVPADILNASFSWLPGAPGEFSLIARVTDQDGNTAFSPAVLVDVAAFTPDPKATNGKADDSGAGGVYPASDMNTGSAPVPPPAPGQNSPAAGDTGPSLADWITNLTNHQPPAAPELAAAVDGCSVNLQIHDLSNNEEGFQVFRSLNSSPAWNEIATLNSQSQSAWISYTDTLVAGNQASYYVTAVNGAGQAQSNPVSASIDPANCGTAPDDQQVLQIELKSFDAGGADHPYCYRSFDNTHWGRWPESGFLDPASLSLNPQATRMTFARKALYDGLPDLSKLGLSLECWGWTGGQLKFLGKVQFSSADLSTAGLHPASDGGVSIILITFGDPGNKVPFKLPSPPQSANLPFITAWLSYDPNQCKTHLPANAQNDLGAFIFCSPYPGYTIGAGTGNPQPYLIWSVLEHTCPAGFNTDCAPLATLEDDATKLNGKVFFLLDHTSTLQHVTYSLPIGRTSYVPSMANCPSDFTVTVTLDFVSPKGGAIGVPSNPVVLPCTQPLTDSAPVKVTFNSITLNNVKDGESEPQDVELYGTFHVTTPSGFSQYLNLGQSDSSVRSNDNCPNEDLFQGFHTNGLGGLGCLDSYMNGTKSLADEEMCAGDVEWLCWFDATQTSTAFTTNNNTITVPAGDGDSIAVSVEVWDYDSASADDLVCQSNKATQPATVFQWASQGPQTLNLSSGDFGSGTCSIKVTIAH